MKKIVLVFLCSVIMVYASAQNPSRFFSENRLLIPGTFYYPEHWPESQWERDFKKMADMGFEYVHMAEFAWAFLEPNEGEFNFEWLDKAVSLAANQGLKIILCTPTATIPAWMGEKYPDIYLTDSRLMKGEHGSRQNNSLVNNKYIESSARIVRKMAQHYGKNPHIWGWQIDNEPQAKDDYSPASHQAFRQWLKNKYETIDALNHAWGAAFWSIKYNNFDQINIHNPNAIQWWGNNPHALLDFRRFTAQVQANDLDRQAKILRQYINQNQFITTNYVAAINNADPTMTKELDFIAYTAYPNNGSANLGKNGYRLGDHTTLLHANDFYRPIKGITGVMEIQPGQVNWASTNSMLLPGTVRMWLFHSLAAGARFASSYRFRQVLFGVEQYHSGIIKPDGISPSQGGKEYMQFIQELKMLEKLTPDTLVPQKHKAMRTAILWSHENLWDHNRQAQNNEWNLRNHTLRYHQALKSLGAPVDYVAETDNWNNYPTLLIPAYQSVDSTLVDKMKEYTKQGGNLIITCRTASKNPLGHFWEAGWSAPLYDLIGADISAYDMLPQNQQANVSMNGKNYTWNTWADLLDAHNTEYSIAQYSDQFYKGKSAVVQRKLGKGLVTYIGVHTIDGDLEKKILAKTFTDQNIKVSDYPPGIYTYWRNGFWIAVNYSSEKYMMNLPANAKIIIGDKNLPSPGVLVWTE